MKLKSLKCAANYFFRCMRMTKGKELKINGKKVSRVTFALDGAKIIASVK